MKRTLKFWTRHTWETMKVEFAVVAVLSVITLLGSSGLEWSLFVSTVPLFLIAAALLSIVIVTSTTTMVYNPLLISMGETRRNIFIGSCYYRVLIIGVTVALCGMIWMITPNEIAVHGLKSLFNILVVLVTASSLGSIFGTLYVKWRWVGALFLGLFGGIFGGMSGFVLSSGIQLKQDGIEKASLFLQELPWWILLIALGLLALDLFFHWMLLRQQEVKF